MKILILSIIIHFIAFNVNGQTSKKYFYNTLLEQTNTYSDSINYFILKIKCIRSGKIDKIDVTFFRKKINFWHHTFSKQRASNVDLLNTLTYIIKTLLIKCQ